MIPSQKQISTFMSKIEGRLSNYERPRNPLGKQNFFVQRIILLIIWNFPTILIIYYADRKIL